METLEHQIKDKLNSLKQLSGLQNRELITTVGSKQGHKVENGVWFCFVQGE